MDDFDVAAAKRIGGKDLRERAAVAAAELSANGEELLPVSCAEAKAKGLATSFWGRAWCANLESYSYHAGRLPRGRSALRAGAVLDLRLASGRIDAKVLGARLFELSIRVDAVAAERWTGLKASCAGQVDSWLDLLQGRLSKAVMELVVSPDNGLFPEPQELHCSCSCPDDADLCDHAAAALYGVGVRLDAAPDQLFLLRGVAAEELVSAAAESAETTLDGADLGALFGLDME